MKRINIVNKGDKFNKAKYEGALGDYDKDGLANIDDANPYIKENKPRKVESIELAKTFEKLLTLKNKLDETMDITIGELDTIAPKGALIYARTKTPYSILKKLVEKRLLDKKRGLTDLVGTTIVVDDLKDLRKVDKAINNGDIGKVVEREDMYESPKGGYRAIHYLVEVDGYIVEVQLKTKRQKAINEESHEPYKKGTLNAEYLLYVTDLANKADKGNRKAYIEFDKIIDNPTQLAKDLDTSFSFGGEIAKGYDVNINSGVGNYAKGGQLNWLVEDGKVMRNGETIAYYDFDRDSDSFWINMGAKDKSFQEKEDIINFFKKRDYAKGGEVLYDPIEDYEENKRWIIDLEFKDSSKDYSKAIYRNPSIKREKDDPSYKKVWELVEWAENQDDLIYGQVNFKSKQTYGTQTSTYWHNGGKSEYAKGGDLKFKEVSAKRLKFLLKLKRSENLDTLTDYKVDGQVYFIAYGSGKDLNSNNLYLFKKTNSGNKPLRVVTTSYANGGELMDADTQVDYANGGSVSFADFNPAYSFAKGGKTDDNWIQDATAEMEKKGTIGTFTAKAKRYGMTPQEFAKKVLADDGKANYTLKTKKQAQFMKNSNPEMFSFGGEINRSYDVNINSGVGTYAQGGEVGYYVSWIEDGQEDNERFGANELDEAKDFYKQIKSEKFSYEKPKVSLTSAKDGSIVMGKEFAKGGITEAGDVDFPSQMLNYAQGGSTGNLDGKNIMPDISPLSQGKTDNWLNPSINTAFVDGGGDVMPEVSSLNYAKGGKVSKDKFFKSKDAEKLFKQFKSIEAKTEKGLDEYYDFIDGLVNKGLIDARLRERVTSISSDLDSINSWFSYNLKQYAKGGKTQGYNSRLDESLAERDGAERGFEQKKKDRRDESKAMEKSMGKRAYSSVRTMDRNNDPNDLYGAFAKGGELSKPFSFTEDFFKDFKGGDTYAKGGSVILKREFTGFPSGEYELVREIAPTKIVPEGFYEIIRKDGKKIKLAKTRFAQGGEINTISELYEVKKYEQYPYARDLVAHFIYGDDERGNLIVDATNGRYTNQLADYSELSDLMLGYENAWRDEGNMREIDGQVRDYFSEIDILDYYAKGGRSKSRDDMFLSQQKHEQDYAKKRIKRVSYKKRK